MSQPKSLGEKAVEFFAGLDPKDIEALLHDEPPPRRAAVLTLAAICRGMTEDAVAAPKTRVPPRRRQEISEMLADSARAGRQGIRDMEQGRSLYPIYPGDHLDGVAAKMAEVATREGVVSYCIFNEVELTVAPGEAPEVATARWQAAMNAKAEAYRASPEGRAAKAKRDAEGAERQRRHDASMASLPDRFNDHRAALAWMQEYADNSDWITIQGKDYPRVIAACEASGYARSDCINLPESAYQDPDTMARYVMGQALDGMYRGVIHSGMVIHFSGKAMKLLGDRT